MKNADFARFEGVVASIFALAVAGFSAPAAGAAPLAQNYGRFGVRRLQPDTPVKGARIVAAEDLLPQAKALARGVAQRTGLAIEAVTDRQAGEDPWTGHLILLGRFGSNRLFDKLYGLRLTPVDGWYPGEGAFLLHPICDPFGRGGNVVVLGCQDAAGAELAAAALLRLISGDHADAFIPWAVRAKTNVGSDPHLKDALARVPQHLALFRRGGPVGADGLLEAVSDACTLGEGYAFTGNEAYGEAVARLLPAFADHVGRIRSMPPGQLRGWSPRISTSWRLLEPAPLFTEAQRRSIAEAYARIIEWDMNEPYVRTFAENCREGLLPLLRRNKYIFSSFGVYLGLQYFSTYFPGFEEQSRWRELAAAMFDKCESIMCMDDATNYFFHVPVTFLRYAAASGDQRLMKEAARMARLLVMFVDPLGENTQVGDGVHFTLSSSMYWGHSALLHAAALSAHDPLFAGVLDKVKANHVGLVLNDAIWPIFMFHPGAAGRLPERRPAIEYFPLDEGYYEDIYNPQSEMYYASGRQGRSDPPNVPRERAFFKMVWREGWDASHQYMMLDGVEGAIHSHRDGNTINSLADRGRIWLADRSYTDSAENCHNGLMIFRNGDFQPKPYLVGLEALADMERVGYTRTSCRDYGGADWDRHIFWIKGDCFLVIDEATFHKSGEYVLQNYWHVIGDCRLGEKGAVIVRQRDRALALINADGASIETKSRRQYALSMWGKYPYFTEGSEPNVTEVRQIKANRPASGDRQLFANLLIAGEGDAADRARMRRLNQSLFAVETNNAGPTLIGLHGLTDSDDGPHTDAKAYVLARETLSLADASRLEIRGTVIEFSQPASFEMDVRSGRATQAKGKAARVKINGREAATDAAGGFAVPAGAFDAAYATWLQRRAATAASPDTWREPADLRQQPAEHLQQLTARRIAQCGETATCAIARNLGREASATLLMGTLAGEVLTFHPSGLLRWRRPVGSPVNALAVADFGDRRVIAAAVEDWRVQIIEAGGQLGWSKKLEIPFRLPESLRGVTTIAAARSGKSGADDLVLGTAVLDVYRLDRTGRVVWREAAYHRGVNALTVADFDGDGVEQAVVGMEASLCHVEQDGRLLRRRSLGANLKVVQTARFDGDPLPMILVGSANGFVTCVDPRANRIRWSAALGGEVTALAATQDGLGGGGALAGAEGMYVHSFDRRGAERWRRRLTDRIEAIRPVRAQGRSLLMVGAADGGLWLLDAANGRPLAFQRIDGRVLELLAFGPDGQWAAATTTGGIWMIRLPPGNGWDSRLDPRRASKHGPPASDCLRAALRLADKDKSLFDDGE